MDQLQEATAAGSISGLRGRVRELLARPQHTHVELPRSEQQSRVEIGSRVHERWRIQSEQGTVGTVPVLCVHGGSTSSGGAGSRRRPAVVFLHGTGSRKEDLLPELERYADRRYIACAVDSRYHGERGSFGDYVAALVAAVETGEQQLAAGADPSTWTGERPFMYDTVHDLRAVVDWLVGAKPRDRRRRTSR